jgi:hypothetical protein
MRDHRASAPQHLQSIIGKQYAIAGMSTGAKRLQVGSIVSYENRPQFLFQKMSAPAGFGITAAEVHCTSIMAVVLLLAILRRILHLASQKIVIPPVPWPRTVAPHASGGALRNGERGAVRNGEISAVGRIEFRTEPEPDSEEWYSKGRGYLDGRHEFTSRLT